MIGIETRVVFDVEHDLLDDKGEKNGWWNRRFPRREDARVWALANCKGYWRLIQWIEVRIIEEEHGGSE